MQDALITCNSNCTGVVRATHCGYLSLADDAFPQSFQDRHEKAVTRSGDWIGGFQRIAYHSCVALANQPSHAYVQKMRALQQSSAADRQVVEERYKKRLLDMDARLKEVGCVGFMWCLPLKVVAAMLKYAQQLSSKRLLYCLSIFSGLLRAEIIRQQSLTA